jgi:hypothetical protein
MDSITTTLKVGKYTFNIIDNTLSLREQIYCRNFKIGCNQTDCINISISYNQNQPFAAVISHIVSGDADCSLDSPPLDQGQVSVIMIKTVLQHIHKQLPTIAEVQFEDKSTIECAPDVRPIQLYYFSIAFNGETWYEKYFNARQKDKNKHDKYKTTVKNLLYSEELKTKTAFIQFLEIAQPPVEITNELEQYYNKSVTFGDFFQMMPKQERCRLVRDWIHIFMSHYLKDVIENAEWIIELPIAMNGGRRHTRKYYCLRGRIAHKMTYKDFGIDLSNFS